MHFFYIKTLSITEIKQNFKCVFHLNLVFILEANIM